MQPGLVGALGILVVYPLVVVVGELRQGTEVAVTLGAAALVLGAQLIDILVMDKEVRNIVYFTRSKISEIIIIINYFLSSHILKL